MLSTWTQIERLLNDHSTTFPVMTEGSPRSVARGWPAVDVVEDHDAFILLADLPGMSKEDVQLTIEGRVLTLAGGRSINVPEEVAWHCRERRSARFSRRFILGSDLDATAAEAVFDNGVLSLRIPKTEAARPFRIEVR